MSDAHVATGDEMSKYKVKNIQLSETPVTVPQTQAAAASELKVGARVFNPSSTPFTPSAFGVTSSVPV